MNPSTIILQLLIACMLASVHRTLGQTKGTECSKRSDCGDDLWCIRNRCIDLCEDGVLCGVNADCTIASRNPICSCPPNYTGDPFVRCTLKEPEVACPPNACGNNTFCKVRDGRPICSCLAEYIGDPLSGCRHECEKNDDCGSEGCCRSFDCYPGPCEPFLPTFRVDDTKVNPEHPCDPDPCAKNEICLKLNGNAFCRYRYAR